MRVLSTLSLLAASVSVLAQEPETSNTAPGGTGSPCDAQTILDTCIKSIQRQVDACGANEWDCLCEQTNNLLTCYNNCPGDGGRNGVQQQKVSYCNAAGMFSSTTTSTRTTSTSTSTATSNTSSPTGDGPASPETSDGAAVGNVGVDLGLGAVVGLGLAVLGAFA
ncbi:GPI anchored serine-threonine rich protein [Aspergillus lucknowensis]|uniref:GPI anchored serine-threonine rich protein n=1 Tax=Aspergillus lucknowensis TaxID=176173 RepID=A0ABR4M6C8_9EURO